jgi:hypothetical protein
VLCDAGLERVRQHRWKHARRVPDADRVEAGGSEPLNEVVHGQVRRRARQDRFAAGRRPPDHLDQHGRLPGAGRATDERHVFRALGEIEGAHLLGAEPPGQCGTARPHREPRRLALTARRGRVHGKNRAG